MFFTILSLALLLTPHSFAGFGVAPQPLLLDTELPSARTDTSKECVGGGGISNAYIEVRDAKLLAGKFTKIPVGVIKSCSFDGDTIAVERYAEYVNIVIVTTVNGQNRMVYDPSKSSVNNLVQPDMSTWSHPDCPGSTVQWLMEEQLERLFACYPEDGYHVTTKAEDAANRKAILEQEHRALYPEKNPGL